MRESNQYAIVDMGDGKTIGGRMWKEVTVPELKYFIAISLYIGMERQSSLKSYQSKKDCIFYCPAISSFMTC